MITQKGLYKSLKNMIEWTRQQQDRQEERTPRGYFSPRSWLNEFCTVRFCLPRQSGHTTFAKRLLEENGSTIYVAPNDSVWRIPDIPRERKVRVADVLRGNLKGRRFSLVIVDCASLLSQQEEDKMCKELERMAHNEPHFVLLFLE